jgi:hypothetical protein
VDPRAGLGDVEKRELFTLPALELRTLGRTARSQWLCRTSAEDNINIFLRETEWSCIDWIHLAHDRDQWRALVNTVMNLRVS